MTTNINVCPQCGAELSADAPEGLCPQCLLKAGLESSLTDLDAAEDSTTPPPDEVPTLMPTAPAEHAAKAERSFSVGEIVR